jgi:hypothetical protein
MLILIAGCLCVIPTQVSAVDSSFKGNILEVALFMRTSLNVPIIVDPSLLNEKMMNRTFRIDTTSGEQAIQTLRTALQAESLTLNKAGAQYWLSSSADTKVEDSRLVSLILNSGNYRALAGQLRTQAQTHDKKDDLIAAANLIAAQQAQPPQIQRDIKAFTERMRGIDFQLRQAVAGSSLSGPNPAKAQSLSIQKEGLYREIIQKGGTMLAALNKALDSPPPELLSIAEFLPEVAYQKMDSDYLSTAFANYKLYMDASSAFGFDTNSEELNWAAAFEEGLRKRKAAIKAFTDNYQKLLADAGLAGTGNNVAATSSTALDAALQLFDVHGDRRQAVRQVIGDKIMSQLEQQVRQFRSPSKSFSELKPRSATLYLFDSAAKEQLSQLSKESVGPSFEPYDSANDSRLGAVTALVAGALEGGTRTLSVELEPKSKEAKDSQPTIDNIFGSAAKQVSLHAADSSRVFMDVSFYAAIKDSLDLIASRYAPNLFESSVSVAFDSTTDISAGGDSAGVALGLATLSKIKEKPLDRKMAVTGSVRRYGDVRPVGGIYRKGKAAFDEDCLVLLLPAQNMDNIFYLPPKDVLSRHVFAAANFNQAAGIAGLSEEGDNARTANAVQLYNFAVLTATEGKLSEALEFAEAANRIAPFHFSSRLMSMLLRVAQVKPSASPEVASLIKTTAASKPPAEGKASDDASKGTASQSRAVSSSDESPLDHILPVFAAEGITGSEAITKLAQELRKLTGKPVNVVVKNRDKTTLATTDMHLSTTDTKAEDILRMICTLGSADFSQDGDIIIVSPLDNQ